MHPSPRPSCRPASVPDFRELVRNYSQSDNDRRMPDRTQFRFGSGAAFSFSPNALPHHARNCVANLLGIAEDRRIGNPLDTAVALHDETQGQNWRCDKCSLNRVGVAIGGVVHSEVGEQRQG